MVETGLNNRKRTETLFLRTPTKEYHRGATTFLRSSWWKVIVGVAVLCLSGSGSIAQDTANLASEWTCPVELAVVTYPELAWRALITGEANVHVAIDDRGSVAVDVDGVHIILVDALKRHFNASTFDKKCNGRTLNYVVEFQQAGAPNENLIQTITYRPPNSFSVKARPPLQSVIID